MSFFRHVKCHIAIIWIRMECVVLNVQPQYDHLIGHFVLWFSLTINCRCFHGFTNTDTNTQSHNFTGILKGLLKENVTAKCNWKLKFVPLIDTINLVASRAMGAWTELGTFQTNFFVTSHVFAVMAVQSIFVLSHFAQKWRNIVQAKNDWFVNWGSFFLFQKIYHKIWL